MLRKKFSLGIRASEAVPFQFAVHSSLGGECGAILWPKVVTLECLMAPVS
jgi:hypothetical protein